MKKQNKSYYPEKEAFLRSTEDINMLTVYRKFLADTETPINAFQKIGRGASYSYLLESAEGKDKLARYSFLGLNPFLIFQSKGNQVEINYQEKKENYLENPFLSLRRLLASFQTNKVEGLPRFWGGGVGYFGYDLVRFIEDLSNNITNDLALPDCMLVYAGTMIVFDHLTHQLWIIANVPLDKDNRTREQAYEQATEQIEKIISQLNNSASKGGEVKEEVAVEEKELETDLEKIESSMNKSDSNMTKEEFVEKVIKAKEYILAGEAFQIVLSQRLNRKTSENPFKIYRLLRSLNPSPYMYYLNYGETQIVGASPEPLVRLTGKLVESKPVAGTRPRGENYQEDLRLEKDLLSDEKEKAEHTMLVDLARNDLGRVCRPGTVKVSQFMQVERFSQVMHLVSEVQGIIQTDKNALDALIACFPAGTVSGAPKVRAMEIIDELEPHCRGPYAGAIGYLGFNGNMDTCITIRTIVFKGREAYIQAGAGIVSDSVPEKEYTETLNKAQALLKAIELAEEFPDDFSLR